MQLLWHQYVASYPPIRSYAHGGGTHTHPSAVMHTHIPTHPQLCTRRRDTYPPIRSYVPSAVMHTEEGHIPTHPQLCTWRRDTYPPICSYVHGGGARTQPSAVMHMEEGHTQYNLGWGGLTAPHPSAPGEVTLVCKMYCNAPGIVVN